MTDQTICFRPGPRRPEYGLQAWQSTVGYISQEHSPDAMLSMSVYPLADASEGWTASVSWEHISEEVATMPSLPEALRALWIEVDLRHKIFKSFEDMSRRPINYDDDHWLDEGTAAILQRLIQVSATAFGLDWRIVMVYQPVEMPETRVQASLFARQDQLHVSGRGPSLREACQSLYRNAASYFVT